LVEERMRIVIVGNGVAGMEASRALRAREPQASITIVSEESSHFFARTALLYVLAGQQRMREIEPLEREQVARLGLNHVRARVTRLNGDARTLSLDDGTLLPFDRLLIACGSRPNALGVPGDELCGVGHFVTLADLSWLHEELHLQPIDEVDVRARDATQDSPYARRESAARRRGRVAQTLAVIGGGLIGIEAVEAALAARRRVHFFVREEWYWPMAIDARESAWIARELGQHGCHVHIATRVSSLAGENGVVSAVVSVGADEKPMTTACDAVVVAVGVRPNTRWLSDSGLALDERGGIVVDETLSASLDGVFAAGDCASVPQATGQHGVEQLWYTARDQGRVAARSMLGDDDARYRRGVWYNSAKLMDIEFTTVGRLGKSAPAAREWYFEETGRVRSTWRVVDEDGAVVGVNVLGRRVDHEVLIRFIEERRSPREVVERLGEAAFDTEFVPRLKIPRDRFPDAGRR
jgi:NAD(P)H-nitrite reductase large subunit